MADPPATASAQEGPQEAQGGPEKKKHLSNSERNAILQSLLTKSDGARKLNYGAVSAVAKEFNTTM